MQFTIQPEGGACFAVVVPATAYVGDIKAQVSAVTRRPVDSFELAAGSDGAPLQNDTFVSKVPYGTLLRMVHPPVAHIVASTAYPTVATATLSSATPSTEDPSREECCICLENFAPTVPPMILKCKHGFHEQCIREWGKTSAHCPLCRRLIEVESPPPGSSPAATSVTIIQTGAGGRAPIISFAPSSVDPPRSVQSMYPRTEHLHGVSVLCSAEDVAKMLRDTRDRLLRSVEFQNAMKAIDDFRKSETAKYIGRTAVSVGKTVASVGGGIVKSAADNLIASNSITKGIASSFGYKTKEAPRQVTTISYSTAGGPMVVSSGGGAATILQAPSYAAPPPSGHLTAMVVQCPLCHVMLQAPAGAPLFRCVCGTTLSR